MLKGLVWLLPAKLSPSQTAWSAEDWYRVLRERDPVHWQEECDLPVFRPGTGFFALTRYDYVAFVVVVRTWRQEQKTADQDHTAAGLDQNS